MSQNYYHLLIPVTLVLVLYAHSSKSNNTVGRFDLQSNTLNRNKRQFEFNSQKCRIPNNSPNTKYYLANGAPEESLNPGDYVINYKAINISCDERYKVSGKSSSSTCINGKWYPIPQTCLRTCPSLTSTSSTTVECRLNNVILTDCNHPVEGTIATLSCKTWFEQPYLDNNPRSLCKNGGWDRSIQQCYATCGVKASKGQANIIQGQDVEKYGDYPWHVGVYNIKKNEIICGGAIIEPHAILSAAHCFTDYYGKIQPEDNYMIAAGKYYRNYDDERDHKAQKSAVLKILIPERFKSQINLYAFDLAVIILKDPFQFSAVIQPVCITLKAEKPQVLDNFGIVTGWGYTSEGRELAEVLKELVVPIVSFNQCFDDIAHPFRKYITGDKICAGYKNNGTSVCQGDSGGGLVSRNSYDERYYLIGLVSTSPSSDGITCNSNEYGTYTDIRNFDHIQFIDKSVTQYRQSESVECTRTECLYGNNENRIQKTTDIGNEDLLQDPSEHRNVQLLPSFCGPIYKPSNIVLNQKKAYLYEYPWMALIKYQKDDKEVLRCEGTIINDRYILTNAYCISHPRNTTMVGVRVGEYNLTSEIDCESTGTDNCADPFQDIAIEEVIPHPDYNSTSNANDIGLLRLRTPIKFSDTARPICLPTKPSLNYVYSLNEEAIVTGWGGSAKGDRKAELRMLRIPIMSQSDCIKIYKESPAQVNHKNICAGRKKRGNKCDSDPRGPLQTQKYVFGNIRYIQMGVFSFGSCRFNSAPNVYTRTDYYMIWILENIHK